MTEHPDPDARRRVEQRASVAKGAGLAAPGIDEIVLDASGLADVHTETVRAAQAARKAAYARINERLEATYGACAPHGRLDRMALLSLVAGASAAGGIFGRYGRATGWTWMTAGSALVLVAIMVAIVWGAARRPVTKTAMGFAIVATVVVWVAGGIVVLLPDVPLWERLTILGSMTAAAVAVLHIRRTRKSQPASARAVDLAEQGERRTARAELELERARLVEDLVERLSGADADLERLGELWSYASACVEGRGVTAPQPSPGPVGASTVAALATLPHDGLDEALARLEAKWDAAEG